MEGLRKPILVTTDSYLDSSEAWAEGGEVMTAIKDGESSSSDFDCAPSTFLLILAVLAASIALEIIFISVG